MKWRRKKLKLNIRQRKVVEATESKILCLAAAAGGKTRTLTERIRYLIECRSVKPEDIVAITFTNMAADEMKKRLGDICTGSFIGTIHSYANGICLANGIDTQFFINTFNFDAILKKALAISIGKYPKIKHLLIDECQDLGALEYSFLERLPSENFFFCGDERQAIYGFKGGSVEYLENLYKDNNYKKYFLVENYRNAPNILRYAENFLGSFRALSPHSIPYKTKEGIIEECGLIDAIEELEWSQNWGSWFVLTRTNNELVEVQSLLNDRGIPNVTFKKGDLNDLAELNELMASNRVKILTIHTSKGLENKNVIVTGARLYNEEERKIAYVAATRAENALYWCPSFVKRHKRGQGMNCKAEAGRLFEKTSQEMIMF